MGFGYLCRFTDLISLFFDTLMLDSVVSHFDTSAEDSLRISYRFWVVRARNFFLLLFLMGVSSCCLLDKAYD